MIITNSRYALVGYFITSYPTRAHGIIVNYLTIRPVARGGGGGRGGEGYGSEGEAEWSIDPWPLRAKGLIVLVSPN